MITPGSAVDLRKADTAPVEKLPHASSRKSGEGERGDVMIRGLWQTGTECIIDVRVTDTDAKSNLSSPPATVLAKHERQKKKKYLANCLEQRRTFLPFVASTDGLLGFEAKNLLKQISNKLVDKWQQPYSVVRGMLNARISLALVRSQSFCLRGARTSPHRTCRRVQWSDGAGLNLFETNH